MNRRAIRRDSVWQILALAGSQALTAVLYILAARGSSPDVLGPVVAIVAAAQVVARVVDWGSNTWVIRALSARELTYWTFGGWYLKRALWYLPVTLLFPLLVVAVLQGSWFLGVGAGAVVLMTGLLQPASAPLRAQLRMRAVSLFTISSRVIMVGAGVGLLVLTDVSLALALPWLLALGAATESLILVAAWPADCRHGALGARYRGNPWRGAFKLGASSAVLGFKQADVTVVLRFAGTTAAGAYGAVSRWTAPLVLLPLGFAQANYPRLSAATSRREYIAIMRDGLPLLAMGLGSIAIVFTFADSIALTLLGSAYSASGSVLRVLSMAAIPALVYEPLAALLRARRRESELLLALLVAVPLELISIALLSARWGAVGAAVGLLLGETVLMLLVGLAVLRLATRRAGVPALGAAQT